MIPTNQTSIVSAILAGVITIGSALTALLINAQSFDEISGPAYAVVFIGGILTVAKDLQSSIRNPTSND